ncbi:MAG TPA: CARDB domain-containing protein, partial [Anaerolineae bacterium]|nr:CARDB domain-containing protein [Anaerolineae bacterium]
MNLHLAPARVWATVLFIIGLCLAAISSEAQPPDPPGESHRPSSPTGLVDGEPLPGAGFSRQPVARPAPAGWAAGAPPPGIDLDVTYIERAPMYKAYCVDYPGGIPVLCPGTEGEQRWPAPGEVVTFTAHIVNKGTVTSPVYAYRWTIDGAQVASGTLAPLAPAAEITATYQWVWAHTMDGERVVDDHTIGFVVDPDDLVGETYEANNQLVDRTNALGFRFVITPEMYEAYNTPWDPAFSYSAEDWLQRQVAAMNWVFANSIYPTTPAGATERVRINEITVSPDPPPWDREEDGGWFVDGDYRLISGWYDPVTDIDWALVHELSHQVGLIDLYNLNVAHSSVQVLDQDGGPANLGFGWPRPDLMGGGDIYPHTDHHLYSSHSAGGISSTKGSRRGYYGEYQFDIPEENYLLLLDNEGNPAGGVQVSLYQREGPANWMGELAIDNAPEITGTTGADGRVLLANRPVGGGITTRTGHVLRDNPFGVVDVVGNRNIFFVKLIQGEHEEFAWLDITAFNLAFWAGDTASHTFVLDTHVPPAGAPAAPVAAPGQVQGDQATVCWDVSSTPGVVGYYVYRAGPPYARASGLLSDLCYTEAWAAGRVYAVSAVDGAGRESGFSNLVWAPRLVNPTAVAETADGVRVVLDPQNGHALLRQAADGRYLQNFGSVHYHLEASRFLAIDADDHLIFSHPGDWYDSRHSIRIADEDATPIFEFGERGTAPGQFEYPAGVAVVGQPAGIEGPYPVDEHTLLLLHLDGSYDGAQGEVGT